MRYKSQKVAWLFFATSMLLLSLQIIYGFIMAFAHMGYDVLHNVIPFNTARTTHTNLLVVWLLTGFMGAAYYIIPEECDRELYWPKLAYVQLAALVADVLDRGNRPEPLVEQRRQGHRQRSGERLLGIDRNRPGAFDCGCHEPMLCRSTMRRAKPAAEEPGRRAKPGG